MLRVLADDHNAAMSLDNLALFADLLYGWLNFHNLPYLSEQLFLRLYYLVRQVILPFVRS